MSTINSPVAPGATTLKRHWSVAAVTLGLVLAASAQAQAPDKSGPTTQDASTQTADHWLQVARAALQANDKPRARDAYEKALVLDPASAPARNGLLWLDIEGNNKAALQQNLARWEAEARQDASYWAPYALANLKTGQFDAAEQWYLKQVGNRPSDIGWQLSFAYELEQAGRAEQSQKLRRDIVVRMRTHADDIERLPVADRKVIMQAHASLARSFESPKASETVLLRMLELGHRDAAVYELLVSATVAQQRYGDAQHWTDQARRDGHRVPAYLELAVAMGRQRPDAVKAVLDERGQELSPSDRVNALRFTGQRETALQLASDSAAVSSGTLRDGLLRQREEMLYEKAPVLDLSLEKKNLGYLDINRATAQLDWPQSWGHLALRGTHNKLRADLATAYFGIDSSETDLSATARFDPPTQALLFTLGVNQRAGDALTYGSFAWTKTHSAQLGTRLDLQVNALTEDTSALRAMGIKDRAAFSVNTQWGTGSYGRLELASHQFHTRQGAALGRGAKTEFELGTRVREQWPQWQMRVSGSAERNRLETSLPASIAGTTLSPDLAVDSIVARRFSTLGVGTTWRFGNSDPLQRQVHGYLDGWTGRQWPASERAYNMRASVNLPVGRSGTVDFEAYYSTVQSQFSSRPNRAVRVAYRQRF